MEDAVPAILNALTLISILILVSLGLAIIFGMMDVINLAHGEFVTIGAYTLAFVQSGGFGGGRVESFEGSYWVGLALAPVVGALFGLLIENTVIRRLYERPLETILATFGISLILQKGIELAFGARPQIVYYPIQGSVPVLGVEYPAYRLFITVFAMAIVAACLAVFRFTQFGVDIRAVIQDRDMAEALGIDTKRVNRIAFAAGAALAATAGVLIAPLASVEAHLGVFYLGKAFFVVIVGGTGTMAGVIAGSGLIGGLETVFAYQMDPSLASALVLIVAIVIFRFRPQGLVRGYSHAHEQLGKM